MSQFLRDVLINDEPTFSLHISELEKTTGESVSARLVADILQRAHEVMRRLGVDTADTNAEELYFALCAAANNGSIDTLLKKTSWVLLPYVDGPVSFNLQDVVDSAHHELPFAERKMEHGQRQLRRELTRRFKEHERTDAKHVMKLAKEAHMIHDNDSHYRDFDKDLASVDTPYLLAIGDIFTDAFIKLSEDVAHVDTDENDQKWLNIPFGGRPPYEEVEIVQSVGPAPNSAVSFARLGLDAGLLAWLGDDKAGDDSLKHLTSEKVDVSLMNQKKDTNSNYYYVLRLGAERTILTKDEDYEYVWHEPSRVPDWIYLASISEDSWQLHVDLLNYLEKHPNTKLVLQPGTFHFKWGKEKLKDIFARSYVTIMNREEAVDITKRSYDSLHELADGLHELGPKIVVITDGPSGSYASFDGKLVSMPNYPDPAPPYDRTGAGDAFASTIVAALALGETMETALSWAPINSMSVVQKLGAQAGLLSKSEIKQYLEKAPADYKITQM